MGAGQSKTETVYSRYSKETEILDSLKITPAVLERVQAAENAPARVLNYLPEFKRGKMGMICD